MKTFPARKGIRFQNALYWVLGLLMIAFSASYVLAQEFRASITGEVQDSTGAVISGVSVSAVNNDTGVRYATKSNDQGLYNLLYILPGSYTVTVEAANFQTVVYKNTVLDSAQKLGLNVTLQPKSVATEVVVEADSLALDTISASTGGVVDRVKVENMPNTGKMVWDSIILTQNIRSNATNPFNITPRNNSTNNTYVVSGTPMTGHAYFINGVPVGERGTWDLTPSTEATDQLQAGVMAYDAQYGRTSGGSFNTNVMGGTNKFHGAVWDYYGNAALNAYSWTTKLLDPLPPKPENTRNTYGGQLGGPIFRNRTFFFANFEGLRQHNTGTVQNTVPLANWKKGDFASDVNTNGQPYYTIYNPDPAALCAPGSTKPGCPGTNIAYVRQQFVGDDGIVNKIPQAVMNANSIGQAVIKLMPDPNVFVDGVVPVNKNYTALNPIVYQYDQYIARADHVVSDNTRAYGMFMMQINGYFTGGNMFPNVTSTQSYQKDKNWMGMADVTHTFSSSKVADLKGYYGKYSSVTTAGLAIPQNFLASDLGLTMPVVPTVDKMITPTFTGLGTNLFANTANGNETALAGATFSMMQQMARHNLHYGAEFMNIQRAPVGMIGNPHGTFNFTGAWTQSNPKTAAAGEGNPTADLLLGYPGSTTTTAAGSIDWDQPNFMVMHYWAFYLQDDYKLRSNLTLNLGLRWDYNTSPYDRHNRMNAGFCTDCANPLAGLIDLSAASADLGAGGMSVSPLTGGIQFAGVNGVSSKPSHMSWTQWQPRIGIAWNVFPETVIRGGYGIFYSWVPMGGNPGANGTSNDYYGFSNTTTYTETYSGSDHPDIPSDDIPSDAFLKGTPYPYGAIPPTGAGAGLQTLLGSAISMQNVERLAPRTQHWSFGIQQKLPWDMLMDLEYLGSYIDQLPVSPFISALTPAQQKYCYDNENNQALSCDATLGAPGAAIQNPFYGALPLATSLGGKQYIARSYLMRSYPMFDGVQLQNVPIGNSRYNGMDVRLERRIRNANFVIGYTYANWMTTNQYLDNTNFMRSEKLWKGLDPADVRHHVKANIVYPLPLIHKNAMLDAVANGWLVSSTLLYSTGNPITLSDWDFQWGAPIASTDTGSSSACTSYEAPEGQTRKRWYNNHIECWKPRAPWEPRTTPKYIGFIRMYPRVFWNAAVTKNFTVVPERLNVRFRAEMLNVPNHPEFAGGDGNAPSIPGNMTNLPNLQCPANSMNCSGPGTLPTQTDNQPRQLIVSLKFMF